MNVKDKVVVVTGGASGMGLATAVYLEKEGAKIAILDQHIENTSEITSKYNHIKAFECDVTSDTGVVNAFSKIKDALGLPQILVNAAGIAPAKLITSSKGIMPLEDFKKVIDVNLIGTFNVVRVFSDIIYKHVKESNSTQELEGDRGVIINTASIAAFEGQIGQAAYAASKGGVVAMTLPLARELARLNIRVNTIAPGLVATPMLETIPEETKAHLIENIPFPKRFGTPQEYASLVSHLISNELINGETIRLDGALRMQSA